MLYEPFYTVDLWTIDEPWPFSEHLKEGSACNSLVPSSSSVEDRTQNYDTGRFSALRSHSATSSSAFRSGSIVFCHARSTLCSAASAPSAFRPAPLRSVTSLGLLSPLFFLQKNWLTTFFSHQCYSVAPIFPLKTDELFCSSLSLFYFTGVSPPGGCHPAPFLPVRPRFSNVLCKFRPIFSFGCHSPWRMSPGAVPPVTASVGSYLPVSACRTRKFQIYHEWCCHL